MIVLGLPILLPLLLGPGAGFINRPLIGIIEFQSSET
jgi:hypothetical protein